MSSLQRRVAVALILVLLAALLYAAGAFQLHRGQPRIRIALYPRNPPAGFPLVSLTEADPTAIKPLTPEEAVKENSAVAALKGPIEPSQPFVLPTVAGALSTRSALDCLTAAVYYESAGQQLQGERAVAQVVLNRVRHPAFPKSVCGVVFQGSDRPTGCQFTFTCDGRLSHKPSQAGWDIARRVALAALGGAVEPSVGTSTHYHTIFVVPYWSPTLQKVATIGAHIFYRVPGYWGMRQAYRGVYAGEAPDPAAAATVPALAEAARLVDDTTAQGALGARTELEASVPDFVAPSGRTLVATAKPMLRADKERGSLLVDDPAGLPKLH